MWNPELKRRKNHEKRESCDERRRFPAAFVALARERLPILEHTMKTHSRRTWLLGGVGALAMGVAIGSAVVPTTKGHLRTGATEPAPGAGQPVDTEVAARGGYLVNQVAMCGDCHTPMGRNGQRVKTKWLRGARIAFRPDFLMQHWSSYAPDIAGLPSHWTAANMIRFLTTGLNPKGHHAEPPMPAFRLNHADALAVTVYLKGLPHGK